MRGFLCIGIIQCNVNRYPKIFIWENPYSISLSGTKASLFFFVCEKNICNHSSVTILLVTVVWQNILGESYFNCLSGRFLVTSLVCQSISGTSSSGTKVSGSVTTQNQNLIVWENPSATIHATVAFIKPKMGFHYIAQLSVIIKKYHSVYKQKRNEFPFAREMHSSLLNEF